MKKIKIAILLLVYSLAMTSQTDTLITSDGKKIAVLITEITNKDVIYKMPSKPDMPLIHFSRTNLIDIILKDGSSIDPKFKQVNPFDKAAPTKAKSIIYFTPSKLFQNHIGVAYEYISKDNIMGIRIPASIAFIDANTANLQGAYIHRSDNKRFFTTGLDLNFYPFKLGKFRYVVGIGFQYAVFAYKLYYYDSLYRRDFSTNENGIHYSLVINNGFITQLSKHFVLSASTGWGIQQETSKQNSTYDISIINPLVEKNIRINATLNIGYMF